VLGPAVNSLVMDYGTADAGREVQPWLRARRPPPYRPGPTARRVDIELGKRLRQARLFVGATRQELAAAMGVSAATVGRYETGVRRMSPKRFAAAVIFFGLPMSWFFSDDGAPGKTPRR
jgi:DNA-binding XRE family transcriptional regulator